ncbi:MAG: proliferating cell nuclear antigen (pcna) [Candidatus Aenigmatarchaeota archaeon]
MFKATLSSADLLRDAISTVGELIDEGVLKADKNGLSLTAADRAMVAVVQFKMPPNVFENFTVEKQVSIPIQITNFVSIIKRAKPDDKIILELKDNRFEVTMKSDSTRKFSLPLIDLQEEELPSINQLEFKTKVRIKSDTLKNGIDDADIVADSVVFEAKKDIFSMKASGDTSSTELVLQKGDQSLLELEGTDGTRARYPLDYLKKMIKASKIADDVTLFWSKDYPMKLVFRDTDKIEIGFVLAPRVQDEE